MSNPRSSESRNPQVIFGPWLKASQLIAGCKYTNIYPDFRGHIIVFAASTVPYRVTDNTPVVAIFRNAAPSKIQSVEWDEFIIKIPGRVGGICKATSTRMLNNYIWFDLV